VNSIILKRVFDGAYKKGARFFGGKTNKNTKNTNGATWRMKHVLNSIRKNNFIAE